ncbi:putative flavin carrier protein 3 [Ophidiomyces ophidiicola]|nr:putative flavin carrier protein 3 [Ophidiomyces ophidiicola]KAI1988574.1 putative flavin carrier protein 3 [Ophidiomyces ophidiicola]KAI1989617.1 putative flavin carrier protein 3 [Ophidiomyces ophidiicola]
MRLLSFFCALVAFLPFSHVAASIKLIESKSLVPCQDNSNFTATLFSVLFTPHNNSLRVEVVGVSSIAGNVTAQVELIAYGFTALKQVIDPCKLKNNAVCPMTKGPINLETNYNNLPSDVVNRVPGVAYGVPDLDLKVRIYVNSTNSRTSIACVEAALSNGKTVYHRTVAWIVAVITGLGLVTSAVTSGLGHSNTAAHVAANALSLFGFFQAQAMIGMSSVKMPPIVQSWTQNFQWSMGIIRVGFIQRLATWYQRATGGQPSTVLQSLSNTSVQVLRKRSPEILHELVTRAAMQLVKRTNRDDGVSENSATTVVRGIERVGFRARIERTNIFMTGLIFFVIFVAIVMGLVAAFKGVCELLAKAGRMKSEKFQDFRHGWRIVMRGILFRLTLIGFPQMCILCLWEMMHKDSPAEVVLAVVMVLAVVASLAWAAWKVIRLAKKSVLMHKNPAYILYSDPSALNKWGFLYIQYRATAYYFVVPVLVYLFVKAMFIALAQNAPRVQAFGLFFIELAMLIGVSVFRPWMDKKTNIFNISIAAVNFFNVLLLLFFTEIFRQPGLVTGVMGVVFFITNVAFALILLILVLIASIYAVVSKNPDTRYQPMRDDRGSFIKSQTQLTTELDALGATARGEGKGYMDDDTSFSNQSLNRSHNDSVKNGVSGIATGQQGARQPPHSPVDTSVPLFPMGEQGQGQGQLSPSNIPPTHDPRGMYHNNNASTHSGDFYGRSQNTSPVPRAYTGSPFGRDGSAAPNPHQYRMQNNGSPWQRGAGYER